MTSGNDGVLFTGGSSISFGRNNKRTEKTIDKSHQRDRLQPAAEVVLVEIDKNIASLEKINFDKVRELANSPTPKALETQMLGQEIALTHMKSLKQRLNNILRENKESK